MGGKVNFLKHRERFFLPIIQMSKTDVRKLHKVFAKYDYDLDELQFEMAMSELDFSGLELKLQYLTTRLFVFYKVHI